MARRKNTAEAFEILLEIAREKAEELKAAGGSAPEGSETQPAGGSRNFRLVERGPAPATPRFPPERRRSLSRAPAGEWSVPHADLDGEARAFSHPEGVLVPRTRRESILKPPGGSRGKKPWTWKPAAPVPAEDIPGAFRPGPREDIPGAFRPGPREDIPGAFRPVSEGRPAGSSGILLVGKGLPDGSSRQDSGRLATPRSDAEEPPASPRVERKALKISPKTSPEKPRKKSSGGKRRGLPLWLSSVWDGRRGAEAGIDAPASEPALDLPVEEAEVEKEEAEEETVSQNERQALLEGMSLTTVEEHSRGIILKTSTEELPSEQPVRIHLLEAKGPAPPRLDPARWGEMSGGEMESGIEPDSDPSTVKAPSRRIWPRDPPPAGGSPPDESPEAGCDDAAPGGDPPADEGPAGPEEASSVPVVPPAAGDSAGARPASASTASSPAPPPVPAAPPAASRSPRSSVVRWLDRCVELKLSTMLAFGMTAVIAIVLVLTYFKLPPAEDARLANFVPATEDILRPRIVPGPGESTGLSSTGAASMDGVLPPPPAREGWTLAGLARPIPIWSPRLDAVGRQAVGGDAARADGARPQIRNIQDAPAKTSPPPPESPEPKPEEVSRGNPPRTGGPPQAAGPEGATEAAAPQSPYLYRIQVRAKESMEGAREIIEYLALFGFDPDEARIERDRHLDKNTEGKDLYTVFVGTYASREKAVAECERLKKETLERPFRERKSHRDMFHEALVIRRDRR